MRPSLEPRAFSTIILQLREPLQRAQENGAFLNAWAVAGLGRNELRNAAVLAWFLDPRGSHGFGATVLAALLRKVRTSASNWPDLGGNFARVAVRTEDWPLGSETERVDIVLDGPNFAAFIEVKIDAREGLEQLRRYTDLAWRTAAALGRIYGRVIYLSPRPPRNPPPDIAFITWHDIASILFTMPRDGLRGALARQFARHVSGFDLRKRGNGNA